MPATSVSINLLGTQDLDHSPQGRIVQWALSYGRYIVVVTEIVVLLAFISRFSLDRKLTDLKEEISQKQAILEANEPFEQQIRDLQSQNVAIRDIINGQRLPVDILSSIRTMLAPDVYFESLNISKGSIAGKTIAGTTQGFSQFLTNLESGKLIHQVEIGEVNKNPLTGISFDFRAQTAGAIEKNVK